jgi:hypothetical protein
LCWTRTRRRRAQAAEAVPQAEVTRATLSGVVSRLVVLHAQSAGGLLELSDAEADAVLAWTIAILCAAVARTDLDGYLADALDALAVPHDGTRQVGVVADAFADVVGLADALRLPLIDDAAAVRQIRTGRIFKAAFAITGLDRYLAGAEVRFGRNDTLAVRHIGAGQVGVVADAFTDKAG